MMIQVPLDNLTKTRQYLAEKVLNLVQTYYTEERLIQITDEQDPQKPRQPMRINEMTPEGLIVNDLSLGEYDVIISTAPNRDTFEEIQFAEAISLRQAGVPIPDDLIVEFSHLARKGDIAERIRAMQGTNPPTPEQAQIQQFQAQAAIQATQLEIAKLEAEIQLLQSQTQDNMSKSQSKMAEPQLRVAEMQSKMAIKQEELALRERLASMTNDVRTGQSETQAASKIAVAAMKPTGGRN